MWIINTLVQWFYSCFIPVGSGFFDYDYVDFDRLTKMHIAVTLILIIFEIKIIVEVIKTIKNGKSKG